MDQEEQAGRSVTQLSAQLSGGASIRNRQRGWVGLIVLLVAVVIVALLAQSALKQYGLLSARAPVAKPGDLPRGPAIGPGPLDPTEATPAPAAPIERARELEGAVQRDAQELSRRMDEQTK